MARTPRLTVGIPVYNGEKYLSRAIESILRQDYEDFELVISDNHSTDRTDDICRSFASKDSRVRYVRNSHNIGAVPNFNQVFSLARGPLFKWLSHDDECYPTMLRRCVDVLDQSSANVALAYPLCEVIDEAGAFQGRLIENVETRSRQPYRRFYTVLRRRTSAQALLGVIRSEYLRRTRMRGSYVMDDCGLLAELAMLGEFREVKEVLLKIRVHPQNAVKLNASVLSHATWLDPVNQTRRFVLPPHLGLLVEHIRSVSFVRMSPLDRLLCYVSVPAALSGRALECLLAWSARFPQRLVNAMMKRITTL